MPGAVVLVRCVRAPTIGTEGVREGKFARFPPKKI